MGCSWCGRTLGAKPERGRSVLVDDLCLDCANFKWKKHQPLADFIEELAYDLGCLRKTDLPGPAE
jgi:hypothetical protein